MKYSQKLSELFDKTIEETKIRGMKILIFHISCGVF